MSDTDDKAVPEEWSDGKQKKGVPCIRYADDIVLLAKGERASERLLETSTKYLEGTLKLKANREKNRNLIKVTMNVEFQ